MSSVRDDCDLRHPEVTEMKQPKDGESNSCFSDIEIFTDADDEEDVDVIDVDEDDCDSADPAVTVIRVVSFIDDNFESVSSLEEEEDTKLADTWTTKSVCRNAKPKRRSRKSRFSSPWSAKKRKINAAASGHINDVDNGKVVPHLKKQKTELITQKDISKTKQEDFVKIENKEKSVRRVCDKTNRASGNQLKKNKKLIPSLKDKNDNKKGDKAKTFNLCWYSSARNTREFLSMTMKDELDNKGQLHPDSELETTSLRLRSRGICTSEDASERHALEDWKKRHCVSDENNNQSKSSSTRRSTRFSINKEDHGIQQCCKPRHKSQSGKKKQKFDTHSELKRFTEENLNLSLRLTRQRTKLIDERKGGKRLRSRSSHNPEDDRKKYELKEEDTKSSHSGMFYVCASSCGYSTLLGTKYKSHVTKCGLPESLSCVHCFYSAANPTDLLHHMDKHCYQTECLYECACHFATNNQSLFSEHLLYECSDLGYNCMKCDTSFDDLADLKQHFKENLMLVVWCKFCRAICCDMHVMFQHLEEHQRSQYWTMNELLCLQRRENRHGTLPPKQKCFLEEKKGKKYGMKKCSVAGDEGKGSGSHTEGKNLHRSSFKRKDNRKQCMSMSIDSSLDYKCDDAVCGRGNSTSLFCSSSEKQLTMNMKVRLVDTIDRIEEGHSVSCTLVKETETASAESKGISFSGGEGKSSLCETTSSDDQDVASSGRQEPLIGMEETSSDNEDVSSLQGQIKSSSGEQEVPTSDDQETSLSGVKKTFSIDCQEASDSNGQKMSPSGDQETSPSDGQETLLLDGQETSQLGGQETSPSDGQETLQSDVQGTSLLGGQEILPLDGQETSPSYGQETSLSDGQETSPLDSKETSLLGGKETSLSEWKGISPSYGHETSPFSSDKETSSYGQETSQFPSGKETGKMNIASSGSQEIVLINGEETLSSGDQGVLSLNGRKTSVEQTESFFGGHEPLSNGKGTYLSPEKPSSSSGQKVSFLDAQQPTSSVNHQTPSSDHQETSPAHCQQGSPTVDQKIMSLVIQESLSSDDKETSPSGAPSTSSSVYQEKSPSCGQEIPPSEDLETSSSHGQESTSSKGQATYFGNQNPPSMCNEETPSVDQKISALRGQKSSSTDCPKQGSSDVPLTAVKNVVMENQQTAEDQVGLSDEGPELYLECSEETDEDACYLKISSGQLGESSNVCKHTETLENDPEHLDTSTVTSSNTGRKSCLKKTLFEDAKFSSVKSVTIPNGDFYTKAVKCYTCTFSSMVRTNLERHIKSCHAGVEVIVGSTQSLLGPVMSLKDEAIAENGAELLDEEFVWLYENHGLFFVCSICKKVICKKFVLHCHLLDHLQISLGICPVCDDEWCSIKDHHEKTKWKSPAEVEAEIKEVAYTILGDVRQGGEVATNLKPCVGTAELNRQLSHLIKRKESWPCCRVCSAYYYDDYSMHRHILVKHQNISVFTCGVCGFGGTERFDVARHMHINHSLEPLCLNYNL